MGTTVYSEVVMNVILDNESPQLVVLNGDLITGENTFLANSTTYVDEIFRPLVQRNLTWASTYGNHDSDYNLSRAAILAKEKTYSGSLTQSMVTGTNAGVSNYYLEVYSSDTTKTTLDLILWFFDSRGGNYYQRFRCLSATAKLGGPICCDLVHPDERKASDWDDCHSLFGVRAHSSEPDGRIPGYDCVLN